MGNVLSHYFDMKHDIVDKFETGAGVTTQDILDVSLPGQYDLVISISTIEHVGWDEDPVTHSKVNEPEKINLAIEKIKGLVKHNGQIVVTLPLGYNPNLDSLIKNRSIPFTRQLFMKRISKDKWVQADWENVKESAFNKPFPFGNAIIVGLIET